MRNAIDEKIQEIKMEQKKYQPKMSFEEIHRRQMEYEESIGAKEMTLDEINEIIAEVRRQ